MRFFIIKSLSFTFLVLLSIVTATPAEGQLTPQGLGVWDIEITQDGKYAYLSFDLTEIIVKVGLEDMKVVAVADLSEYFPIRCQHIVLDSSEGKLFAYLSAWDKLIVIDTQTMRVIHTIPNVQIVDMFQSRYGPNIIAWGTGSIVLFINTITYDITEFVDAGMDFTKILEDKNYENLWFVINEQPSDYIVVKYDHMTKTRINLATIHKNSDGEYIYDFKLLPNEQKAYVGTLGGHYLEGAYGWLYSVDLNTGITNDVLIQGGVSSLEVDIDNHRIYVNPYLPPPPPTEKKIYLLVVDTQSDSVIDSIYLAQRPDTQTNDLQIDPANPHLLYATGGDAFFKVDINNLTCVDSLIFSDHTLTPHWFTRDPQQSDGYILIEQSSTAFKLDIDNAVIDDVIELPIIRDDAFSYDAVIDNNGRLLIAQGEFILEADVKTMHLLDNHPLPSGIPSIWHFILSNDQTKLYSISGTGGLNDTFLAINTENFQLEAHIKLDEGDSINFEFRPYELPDGSKLYAKGGFYNGPVYIKVIDPESWTIQKTITFDNPDLMGTNIGGWHAFAYDSSSHTLFVECRDVVLCINTDTDEIQKLIYLEEVATAIGLEPKSIVHNGAVGLVYNPNEKYLYIGHYDGSFISAYDLDNDRFLPQVFPLGGHLPTHMFTNDDYSKIYTLNGRTGNVTVLDVNTKTISKVIDLNEYLQTKVQDKIIIPAEYILSQNYPNPFNSSTMISYQIPKNINVSIEIYNILGQKVASLVDKRQNAGRYQIQWEGKNQKGEEIASGLYILRFSTSDFVQSKKLLLLR